MTLLEQVGLEDKVNFYVDGLSRGMKQRLCLARGADPRSVPSRHGWADLRTGSENPV